MEKYASEDVVQRFLEYVRIETTSDYDSPTVPSTPTQFDLARLLAQQCRDLGLQNVTLDEKCYVMATLPSNLPPDTPSPPIIGFISHMDTSPDAPGKNVRPQLHESYDGISDIIVGGGSEGRDIILRVSEFPNLKRYEGMDIITASGDTLLGADDKSGLAAIMSAMKYLLENPEIQHGEVKIGFTPDEEIGRSANHFDVEAFGAKYAYTVDGSTIGELEYENFNACGTNVTVKGRSCHPGGAKDRMCNALNLAMEFQMALPRMDRPEHTEKREGYIHLNKMSGDVSEVSMRYILRDHDVALLEYRKNLMTRTAEMLTERYKQFGVSIEVAHKDGYRNMKEMVEPVYDPVITTAIAAMESIGIEPIIKPVRGGTDGARLSFMGLPCPNLFAGGEVFHSKYEFLPVPSLIKAKEIVIAIIQKYTANAADESEGKE